MGTQRKTAVLALVGCAIAVTAAAQTQPPSLEKTLHRSVCERIQAPMVFSTRDTTFALSLPTDEPAMVSLQVTVGKNGKVKEKETRVNANHIAGYIAPAFLAATKDLRIDRNLLGTLSGKDTSLTLTFPLEYQCVLDTMNRAWPKTDNLYVTLPFYWTKSNQSGYMRTPLTADERERAIDRKFGVYNYTKEQYLQTEPTRVWYYLAFIKDQSE